MVRAEHARPFVNIVHQSSNPKSSLSMCLDRLVLRSPWGPANLNYINELLQATNYK